MLGDRELWGLLWHAGDCTHSRHRRHLDDVPGWEELTWLQGKTLCSVMSSIRVSKTGRPTELQFFLNGKLDDSAPLSCSLELCEAHRPGNSRLDNR